MGGVFLSPHSTLRPNQPFWIRRCAPQNFTQLTKSSIAGETADSRLAKDEKFLNFTPIQGGGLAFLGQILTPYTHFSSR